MVCIGPRPYLSLLAKKTSQKVCKMLALKAKEAKKPLVRKTVSKRTGKNQVKLNLTWRKTSLSIYRWTLFRIYRCKLSSISIGAVAISSFSTEQRRGSTGLKLSQIYPRRYGAKVARVHKKFTVGGLDQD